MTLTVTHAFTSGVADDPTAAAAGEVLPSHWNAQHVVTGVALQVATGNLTFYVSTTGSDSHDGLTPATAFATIQHAVSVGFGFDYQALYTLSIMVVGAGTYQEHINVGGGLLFGSSLAGPTNASIIGDPLNPGNFTVQPHDGNGSSIFNFTSNGEWDLDGFTIKADTLENSGGANFINALNVNRLRLGTLNFDTGSGSAYFAIIGSGSYSAITNGIGPGSRNWTFSGDGAAVPFVVHCVNYSRFAFQNNTWVFNSAINLGGGIVFDAEVNSFISLTNIVFTTPGNITNGIPFNLVFDSNLQVGVDPTTLTWPGGLFSASTIDGSSIVDGFLYVQNISGAPVDQTSIYRGSWRILKDTGTGNINVITDTGGTLGFPAVPFLILANGTNPEGIYVYKTVDNPYSPTNYERGIFDWNSTPNSLKIGTQANGTGAGRAVIFESSNGTWNFFQTGTVNAAQFAYPNFRFVSNAKIGWANTTDATQPTDTAFTRSAAGVVEINNGTAGSGPGVLKLAGTTVGGLPAHAAGQVAYVTDGTAGLTFGNTVTGGHATPYLVWDNGTNWTVIGS